MPRDAFSRGRPPAPEQPLTIGVARRYDGRVSLVERQGGVVIAETAMDCETARWLAGELLAAADR